MQGGYCTRKGTSEKVCYEIVYWDFFSVYCELNSHTLTQQV